MRDLQDIALAEQAEAYIREQSQPDDRSTAGGMRSRRRTRAQQEFYDKYATH